jgi:hypothetical protein
MDQLTAAMTRVFPVVPYIGNNYLYKENIISIVAGGDTYSQIYIKLLFT